MLGTSSLLSIQLVTAAPKIELSEEEWYYILSHEVAHYYHGDLWIKIVTEFLHIIYWWNPFVCLLKNRYRKHLKYILILLLQRH
ncbi:M56 family metallopeptidase [Desulfotruncus arcticus]|uniref:M56 family metallopeptidase n=1 Tax=Desulfotruncus arcticus TaxID=341036 RepID=UPI000B85ADBE